MNKVALAVIEWFAWLFAAIAIGVAYPVPSFQKSANPPDRADRLATAAPVAIRPNPANLLRVGAGSRAEANCPRSPAAGIHISLQTSCSTPPKVAPTESL